MYGVGHLVIVYDGIDGDVHLSAKLMSILAQGVDVVDAIACCCSCSVLACTNIHSIGTMVYGADTAFEVFGW